MVLLEVGLMEAQSAVLLEGEWALVRVPWTGSLSVRPLLEAMEWGQEVDR